jgi:hypothetical protein
MNDKKQSGLTVSELGKPLEATVGNQPAITFDDEPHGSLVKGQKRTIEGHIVKALTSGLVFAEAPETYPNLMEKTVISASGPSDCAVDMIFANSSYTVAAGIHQPKHAWGTLTFLDASGSVLETYETVTGLAQYMYSSDRKIKTLRWTSRGGASLDNVYLLGI